MLFSYLFGAHFVACSGHERMFACSGHACSEEHMFETMFVCSKAFLFNSCAIGAMFGTYVRTLFEAMFGGLHVRGATKVRRNLSFNFMF